MRSTIAQIGLPFTRALMALAIGAIAIVESQAQTVGNNATMTPGLQTASALHSDARAERTADKSTRHLTGVRPQGSLHRYYQEQSRAQAGLGNDAPSSRRVVALEMDANWSVSVNNPFSDEVPSSVVTPPDALDVMRPVDPNSYLDAQEWPIAAPPPAGL